MSNQGPSPSGDVSPAVLTRVVAWIAGSGSTGCLVIEHDETVSRAFFREGLPCGAIMLVAFKPLGLLLLENGIIGMDALENSLREVSSTGRPQGEILVEHGHITRDKLSYWLHVQQRDRLQRLLGLTQGFFKFEADAELPPWTNDMELSPHLEVLRFLRSQNSEPHVRALMEMLGDGPVAMSTFDPVPVFGLGSKEAQFLSSLADSPNAASAIKVGELPAADAEALLATLACFYYVTPFEPASAPLAGLPEEAISEALETLAWEAPKSEDLPCEQEPPPESSSWLAPKLGPDGIARFESIKDLDAAIDLFIKQGALLIASDKEMIQDERFEMGLSSPHSDEPISLTCALSAIPERGLALLRFFDVSPSELISALLGERKIADQGSSPPQTETISEPIEISLEDEEEKPQDVAPPPPKKPRPAPAQGVVPPIPAMGRLELPGHPSELFDVQAGRAKLKGKQAVSTLHLLAWLKTTQREISLVLEADRAGSQELEVLPGAGVQAAVDITPTARLLAQNDTRYQIRNLKEIPQRRHEMSFSKLQSAVIKRILHGFDDDLLAEGLGPRMALCPRLSSRGRKVARTLALSDAQARVASSALDGTRRVSDILASGIGHRAAWEILYLLELRGGLDWRLPPENVEEDPAAARWLAIQGKDHFEVLGLHWSSHPGSVEKAFVSLKKLYGPGGKLRDASQEVAEKLWNRMVEAHQAISTKAGRDAHRQERYPSMNFTYQAELLVGQAELAKVRGDIDETRHLLESALDLAPIESARQMLEGLSQTG